MIYHDRHMLMTLFLVVLLLFILMVIYWAFNKKEGFCSICSSNIDWYVGRQGYKELCPQGRQTAFLDSKTYPSDNHDEPVNMKHCNLENEGRVYEGFSSETPDQKFMNEQIDICEKEGYQPAYNPSVCTTGRGLDTRYDYERNCMCTDNLNQCTKCMEKPKEDNLI